MRDDETWHRLRDWTKGQTPSERLAAQILIHEGYANLDPSHPLGGKDGGKDALAVRNGVRYAMAVYFPRGQQSFADIARKFRDDLAGARRNSVEGIAFVTNQELTLSQREQLRTEAKPTEVELYHLERITAILDAPDMAGIREQFLDIPAENSPVLNLGGMGGSAPSAGGGGGGAIGEHATGGAGGPGGSIRFEGLPGMAPGAGGGGSGVVGEGAIGGEGGEGGECVTAVLGPDDLQGIDHLSIRVGMGGIGGPGEDTIVNLVGMDGQVHRSIVARGGNAGRPAYVPPPRRAPTSEDLSAGFKVSGIIAAEFIRSRDGLWTMIDAGWDWYKVNTVPFRLTLPLWIEINTGSAKPDTAFELSLVVLSPDGFQALEQPVLMEAPGNPLRRIRFATALEFSGSQVGIWTVRILGGSTVLGEYPIEIRAEQPGYT